MTGAFAEGDYNTNEFVVTCSIPLHKASPEEMIWFDVLGTFKPGTKISEWDEKEKAQYLELVAIARSNMQGRVEAGNAEKEIDTSVASEIGNLIPMPEDMEGSLPQLVRFCDVAGVGRVTRQEFTPEAESVTVEVADYWHGAFPTNTVTLHNSRRVDSRVGVDNGTVCVFLAYTNLWHEEKAASPSQKLAWDYMARRRNLPPPRRDNQQIHALQRQGFHFPVGQGWRTHGAVDIQPRAMRESEAGRGQVHVHPLRVAARQNVDIWRVGRRR